MTCMAGRSRWTSTGSSAIHGGCCSGAASTFTSCAGECVSDIPALRCGAAGSLAGDSFDGFIAGCGGMAFAVCAEDGVPGWPLDFGVASPARGCDLPGTVVCADGADGATFADCAVSASGRDAGAAGLATPVGTGAAC